MKKESELNDEETFALSFLRENNDVLLLQSNASFKSIQRTLRKLHCWGMINLTTIKSENENREELLAVMQLSNDVAIMC